MRTVRALASVCLLSHSALGQASPPSERRALNPAAQEDSIGRSIDRVFDKWRAGNGPGCAVAVSRNGQPVFAGGYGMANLETGTPIRPTSVFHVASVSKQFTATAIMLLERDGKLSLDDDIRKYLPEIPSYGTTITIRQLLTHVSGLRDEFELLYLARQRFEEDRITEADALDMIVRQTALNFTPGSEVLYSNTGYTLAGMIVRRVSGKSLREFAAERIFQPLGMTRTHFHDDQAMVVPDRTTGYEVRSGPDGPWRVSAPPYDLYGPTNLFTTVGDLLKWEANFDHPIVGDTALFARMRAAVILTGGDTSDYVIGFRRARTYRGARVFETTGNDPGYQAYVGRYPEKSVAIAVTCNAGSAANPAALGHGVADVYLGDALVTVTPPAAPPGIALPIERLRSRVGVYLQPATLTVVRLVMRDSRLAIAGGQALIPLADNRFAIAGQPGEIDFADGEHAGYQRNVPGQRPLSFEWHQPASPDSATLAAYAGDYASTELGGTVYHVSAGDSTLMLRTGTSDPLIARPVFADTFLATFPAGAYTVRFARSAKGVTGFEVTDAAIRRVKFTRIPTAGLSASRPQTGARIIDIMPRYWAFRDSTRSADSATTRALFHQMVIGADSGVYRNFSDGPSDATLGQYLRNIGLYEPAMRIVHERLRRDLPAFMVRFGAAFPDAHWDRTSFYLMPWFFISDAGGGSPPTMGHVMIFGVDGIAKSRGASADLAPLFFHELFHVYQSTVNVLADVPGRARARTPLWELLWNEGLATYVSGRLSPSSSPADVIMDTVSLRQAERRLPELARDLRVHLDSTSQRTFNLYMSAATRSAGDPPPRAGYYVGMLVAAKLAKTYSLPELARLQGPALRADIESALRELEVVKPVRRPLDRTERTVILSRFWRQATYTFPYFSTIPAVNWDSAYAAFIPQAEAASSDWEFYRVMQRFVALLRDGHTRVYAPDSVRLTSGIDFPWIDVRAVDRHAIVDNVGSELAERVPIGSEIEAVDGELVADFLEGHVFPFVNARAEATRWTLAVHGSAYDGYGLLAGPAQEAVMLRIKTPSGSVRTITVDRDQSTRHDSWARPQPPLANLEYRALDEGVAYVAVNTFGDRSVVSSLDSLSGVLLQSSGVVLDLRQNQGGSSTTAKLVLQRFVSDTLLGFRWETRQYVPSFKAWGREWRDNPWARQYKDFFLDSAFIVGPFDTLAPGPGPKVTKPLVILIGSYTASAAEDALIYLDGTHRATTVGEPTFGSSGEPLFFGLGRGWSAQVVSYRESSPPGKQQIIGTGYQPDVLVMPSVADIVAHRDPALERALTILAATRRRKR